MEQTAALHNPLLHLQSYTCWKKIIAESIFKKLNQKNLPKLNVCSTPQKVRYI